MSTLSLQYFHRQYVDKQINRSLSEILETSTLFSVASIKDGKESWINTAYFAYNDQLEFYFLTPTTAQHSKNVKENGSVAVSIFDSHQAVTGKKRGLQIFGTCHRATGKEIKEGIQVYGKRFSGFGERIHTPDDFEKFRMESRIYVVVPNVIKIFDEVVCGEEKWVIVNTSQ